MCGIVGIVRPDWNSREIEHAVQLMTDSIIHRGPDEAGKVSRNGLGIGMRRLSIIDVAGGHQPISNEANTIHVVCNGEIYNYRSVREDLKRRGHQFKTQSDSEVLVHSYEEYGDRFLDNIFGMFGLAIFDERQNRLVIARDRLGKKPLFYADHSGCFYFGSEMKAILAVAPDLKLADYRQLGQYLQFGYIRQPETIYRGIRRLPAGSMGVFENGTFSTSPYWTVSFSPDESKSESQWIEQLDETLAHSVKIRLESEVPLGVFLSGGLDSSAVVAYAHAAGLHPIKTFTVGFDRKEWDESEDAARVAKHFDTDHHQLQLTESHLCDSFEQTLQQIVYHCDEPFGDASAIPTFHVSRLAREHVKVILSGDGGDELFAGYSSYLGALFGQKYRKYVPFSLGRHVFPRILTMAAAVSPVRLRYSTLRAAKVLFNSALPFTQGYREKTAIWQVEELRSLLCSDVLREMHYLGTQYLPEPWWTRLNAGGDLVAQMSETDIHTYMLDDILVKVDRMSMANALEVRSPILDHRMVELAARMPTRFKIREGRGKYVLRKIVEKKLPAATLRKGKQGFSVPLRDWFRGRLRGLVNDYLGSSGYLPKHLFSPSAVQKILNEHSLGTADHANKIWLLLVFAAWHRHYQQDFNLGAHQYRPREAIP